MKTTCRYLAFAAALAFTGSALADDRDTFSSKPVQPNIMWLLDNSGSMDNLPCSEFDPTRCFYDSADRSVVAEVVTDATLGAVGANVSLCRSAIVDALGYNYNATYPLPDPDFPALYPAGTVYEMDNWGNTSSSVDNFCNAITNCAQKERCKYSLRKHGYYRENSSCLGSGDPSGTCGPPLPLACTTGPLTNVGGACLLNVGTTCDCGLCFNNGGGMRCHECDANSDCGPGNTCSNGSTRTCVAGATTSVSTARFTGNFLRFYPPKFVGGRRAVKDVMIDGITSKSRQRVGLFFYNGNSGGDGGSIQKNMGPACNLLCSDSTCDATFDASRNAIISRINSMSFNTNTPLGEALDDIGCYFGNGNSPRACSYRSDQLVATDNVAASTPICLTCQTNFAILITDGLPTSDTSASLSLSNGSSDPEGYILPGVASYLFTNDLDTASPGVQNLITYTVSFGKTDPTDPNRCAGVLERAALAGSGRCFPARNRAQLLDALRSIVTEIDARARSFTAPAVQNTRGAGEANVNLATFKPFTAGPLWEGHLFSFDIFDEFSEETQHPAGNPADPNEILLVDANNGIVNFDAEGNLLSRPYWDAALCLAGDLDGVRGSMVPEDPYNIDVASCARRADELHARARRIYTKTNPLVGTGGSTPDSFTLTNASAIAPLLGTSLPFATGKVIQFFRGFDMFDHMGATTVAPGTVTIAGVSYTTPIERSLSTFGQRRGWWKLGDIYHSSPGIVTTATEYMNAQFTAGTATAYDKFFENTRMRKRQLIVGANDGMIHAFDSGTPIRTPTNADPQPPYTKGSGEELWAFVPPEQLPRMGASMTCPNDLGTPCSVVKPYTYFVDGAPQIRDAYTGSGTFAGTPDNLKDPANADKWKTIMVMGDRDGGTQFTALDVTDPSGPKFLWQFPTSAHLGGGSTKRNEAPAMSWSNVNTVAPIVPVLFDSDGSLATDTDRYKRWVVLINGGFSRNNSGGRGIYMVDANTGELLWKFEHGASGENAQMRYSFSAPPVGVSFPADTTGQGVINMIVAVDTGGQVWTFDLSAPGVLSGGLAQWTGQRLFTTAATSSTTSAYAANPDGNGTLSAAEYPYRPMFSMVAASYGTKASGALWIYVGTGDRDLLGPPPLTHPSGVALDPLIPDIVCGRGSYTSSTYANRFYALKLTDTDWRSTNKGRRVAASPLTEDDLFPLNTFGTAGEVQQLNNPVANGVYGYYLMLRAGEKTTAPPQVFNKVVYFATYNATGACSTTSTALSCTSVSGDGRLYALDYETGRPALDFNSGGGVAFGNQYGVTTTSADTAKRSDGIISGPERPPIDVRNGKQAAALLSTTSANPTPTATRTPGPSNLVTKLLTVVIPRQLHNLLPGLGSEH